MLAGCLGADDETEPEAGDDEPEAGDDDLEEIEDWLNEAPNRLDVLAEEPVEWGDGVWDGELVDQTDADEVEINFSAMVNDHGRGGPWLL